MTRVLNYSLIVLAYLFPLTFIHVILSFYFKIDINYLTLLSLFSSCCFVAINSHYISGIGNIRLWTAVVIFLLLTPVLIACLTFEINFSKYLAQISYLFLIATTFIVTRNEKFLTVLRTLVIFAVFINVLSAILNLIYPSFFYYLSLALQRTFESGDRASGLFLQPNTLALSLVLIYIITSFIYKENVSSYLGIAILSGIFLTGSRSGIISIFIAFLIRLLINKNYFRAIVKYYLPAIISAILIYYFTSSYLFTTMITNPRDNFYTRVTKIFESDAYDYKADGSIRARTAYQQVYIDGILDYPFAGHGFKTQQDFLGEGKIWGSAHNVFLELLYLGGVLYLLIYMYLLFCLIAYVRYYGKLDRSFFSGGIQFIVFLTFISFFSTMILENRLLYICFGLILSIPNLIDRLNEKRVINN